MLTNIVNVGTSLVTTVARGATGMSVGNIGVRPNKRLELYEFEACPFCRKVREALSILDLEADIYPCPKNAPRFRPGVVRRGGRAMFPYLVDPNTDEEMYESDDIVRYLFDRYGDGRVPKMLALGPITDLNSILAGLARPGLGGYYRKAEQPRELLELYSFEASPFCRIVRERLCTLELPYVLHNVAKGSPGREAFVERSGKMQVPYLVDPNTGVEMFESADIVAYLDREYAVTVISRRERRSGSSAV
jgi:glutathione S-transferase